MKRFVENKGPLEPDLMVVGQFPGNAEVEAQLNFVGPSGELLNDCLRLAGIRRSEVFIANTCRYQPPMNDIDQLHLIDVKLEDEVENLWNEIRALRPKCILAVGEVALNAVTDYSDIMDCRGSILLAKDGVTKVVPTIHPAALLSRFEGGEQKGGLAFTWLKVIQSDVVRAVDESKSRKFDLPFRELEVCHSSLQAYRFFEKYKNLDLAANDIESINCMPVCTGFAFNKHHAMSFPLLRNIGPHKLTDMGNKEMAEIWRLLQENFNRLKLIGHNMKYDEFKQNLIGFQNLNVYSDTLIKTRVIFPELPMKSLLVVSSLWTREPYYKSEGKEFRLGRSPIENLFKYNAKDCAVEFEVDEVQDEDLKELGKTYGLDLMNYYYNYMMKKHKFYLNMENNGFRVDDSRKKELAVRYTEMARVVHERIAVGLGYELNVKSYPQMFNLLYKEMGFKIRKKNPTSEDSIVALLGNHAKKKEHKDILTDILEERRIRDQKSRYINFHPDYDGRCKTSFNISATETTRSSTGILDKPVRPRKIGLAFHTISKHGRLAKDIRSMFIPDEGTIFLQADSSQAEARVVAVLSEDWELLKAFDEIDIHRRTAGLIFGYCSSLILTTGRINLVDDILKDGPERFCGKKVRHAGNYNMGKGRFMQELNTDAQKFEINMNVSEWKAGKMLEQFHAASPKIRGVFHRDIIEALQSTRNLIDPFGGLRIFNGRMDDDLYKEGYANIPQRTVAHLVQGAALKIEEELNGDVNMMWLSENHDSLTMQVPKNNWEPYAKLMKKYFEVPIDFKTYCTLKRDYKLVIPCEVEVAEKNYGDFKKVKI